MAGERLAAHDKKEADDARRYSDDTRCGASGAYQFPEAASFRMSFSSVRSDTALRRRAFFVSSSLSRFTWSLPPYCWRSNCVCDRSPLRVQNLNLPQLGDDLLGFMPFPGHSESPFSYKSHTSGRITFQGEAKTGFHLPVIWSKRHAMATRRKMESGEDG
jgi:hypothetical protein